MTRRFDREVLQERARNLAAANLNGLARVEVALLPADDPDHAGLTLFFHNSLHLADLDTAVNLDGIPPTDLFRIRGGSRLPAGDDPGQVRVTALHHDGDNRLLLRVEPVGDYSSYTLWAIYEDAGGDPLVDPLFDRIDFKFRPGCFDLDCAPRLEPVPPPGERPDVDYLARDFDSFRHLLINAMRQRVPEWEPSSEADLDQVILDLLAADGDEICDFQDRVMQEACLGRARKRLSLARYGRLLDYHVHQGNQAVTQVLAEVSAEIVIPAGHPVWSGGHWSEPGAVLFLTSRSRRCFPALDRLLPYHWGEAVTALDAGALQADLALPEPLDPLSEADAQGLRDLLRRPEVEALVIEEALNPATGSANGRDPRGRQLLRLLPGEQAAEVQQDPLSGRYLVRIHWRREDALRRRYCFLSDCDGAMVDGISVFRGNLLEVAQGRPHHTLFLPPGLALPVGDPQALVRLDYRHWEPTRWGRLCTLPATPLSYRDTPPGGDRPTATTLRVGLTRVDAAGNWSEAAGLQPWSERSDLIGSRGGDRHFLVETDERGISRLRFGNGVNGADPGADAVLVCDYQVGQGSAGNVGADRLTGFGTLPGLVSVRNPFDVTSGRDPEPPEQIVRRIPVAYRARQKRAVTLEDYVKRAEELPEVSHAHARYAWSGSWRTVRIAIDPVGASALEEEQRRRIEGWLDAVRLIGEDLEVRPARYVPLDIDLVVCAGPDYWAGDLAFELAEAFSEGYDANGEPGFFHPDAWTFGQPLHASQVMGRALRVTGVERVIRLGMRRFEPGTGRAPLLVVTPDQVPVAEVDRIELRPWEILRVANDPDHLEHGRIRFTVEGGRR
ncbi:MAG TPA: hypothetical protein ENI96_13505 [Sedimenticola thiotaurini]|uniref:Baseplate protein J-like domain-containing protein n=1 Tax=Sedimenticola thiotaurini TaxID=1543721 RepID=A0A831RMK1_9GAMM|nr:hypothetical protein [Sedimenticola thiotaurini]